MSQDTQEVQKTNDGQQQQGGDSNKVETQFKGNIEKLAALFAGQQDIMKTNRVPNDVVNVAIEALLAEKQAKKVEEFKLKAANLLDRKVEFDRFVIQKEREFKEAVMNKKKEFNKEMEECFKLVQSIEEMRKSYTDSLGSSKAEGEVKA